MYRRIIFCFTVQRVVFVASKTVPVGTTVSVTFERGEHVVATGEFPVQAFRDGTHGCVIGEMLTLACTMYKDHAGKYQVVGGVLCYLYLGAMS